VSPQNLDWGTLMQIVPQIFQKYCSEFNETRHFKQKKFNFCLQRELAPDSVEAASPRLLPQRTPLLTPNQAFYIHLCVPRIPARFTPVYTDRLTETDLGPDVLNPRLYKSRFLWLHVAVPVLTTAVDHTAVDTFQYVPAAHPYSSTTTLG